MKRKLPHKWSKKAVCALFIISLAAVTFGALPSNPAGAVSPEPVTIQLRWTHQFQFAGYSAAVEKGFYKAEGLDVSFQVALPDQDRVARVLAGLAQYGVGDAGLLKHRAHGDPLVVVAQIFQHSPSILLTRRNSGIFSYAVSNVLLTFLGPVMVFAV